MFAIEHRNGNTTILINQTLASPLDGGIGRILLRAGGATPANIDVVGGRAHVRLGVADGRVAWEGATTGIRHRVTLRLVPDRSAWLWRVEATNTGDRAVPMDSIFVQDLGLGMRTFVTSNEAYASQYIDHHIARNARYGPVVMSRQNLAQDGKHPWIAHGCLDAASAFATDAMQLFGPAHRDVDGIAAAFGARLADRRLQHETSCAAIQSLPIMLEPHARATWRFFAVYEADHPAASDDRRFDEARRDRLARGRLRARDAMRSDAASSRTQPRSTSRR